MTTVFVFGSNLAGRHGKGAALYARQHHGAVYGQGVGRQGDERKPRAALTDWQWPGRAGRIMRLRREL